MFVRLLDAAPVVGHSQASLAVANPSHQAYLNCTTIRAEGVLDTVHRGLIQYEADG
jgi:hypothetical protein